MKNNIQLLHSKAQQALNNSNFKVAHKYLIAILQEDKYFADAYFLLAMIASAFGNIDKCILLIKQASELAPTNNEYRAYLAKHYALNFQHINALQTLKLIEHATIDNALTLDTIGVAYSKIGLHNNAVNYFKKATYLKPERADFQYNLAVSLKFIGDIDAAEQAYLKVIVLSPKHYKAHAALSSLGKITAEKNHIKQLKLLNKSLHHSDTATAEDKLYIGHALAREYEALKQYDACFETLNSAKKAKLASLNYQLADDKYLFQSIINHYKPTTIPELSSKVSSNEAIFIVGMPRTGTTLVERILSNHNDVSSAGELQNFGQIYKQMSQSKSNRVIDPETIIASDNINYHQLGETYLASTRALTGSSKYFIDKMPLNVLFAGDIVKALPNSKLLCLDRNPLDTIISNYKQLFSVNQSYYNYAYSLTWTAEFYLMFKQLMQFWQQRLPNNFYVINYENLVNNPSIEAEKIFSFCNLTWQDSYLTIENNTSPVATASAVQVRKPINNHSVNNWINFDVHLNEVKKIINNLNPG